MKRFATAISAVGLAVALAVSPAAAQKADGQGQSGKPGPQKELKTDYSDKDIQSFAKAAQAVTEIRKEYMPKLRDAQKNKNRKKMQKIQKEASKKMMGAVKEEGISPKKYRNIGKAARQDKELKKRVLNAMEKQGKKKQQGQKSSGQ